MAFMMDVISVDRDTAGDKAEHEVGGDCIEMPDFLSTICSRMRDTKKVPFQVSRPLTRHCYVDRITATFPIVCLRFRLTAKPQRR